jgi:hypothetical protein
VVISVSKTEPYSICLCGSWGSSLSIVSDYRLDDRETGIRFLEEGKDFSSSLCVQASSKALPASYSVNIGGPFPGLKRGWGVSLTTHPHLVPR